MSQQESGTDVVELIIDDHRRFEELMRELRNVQSDRADLRAQFSALLIAHAEAEEERVYPQLRKKNAADGEEIEHGRKEHAEINDALLEFLEVTELSGDTYDEKLEDLVTVVNHHTNEEEQTLINDARTDVSKADRETLGAAFAEARKRHMDADCGSLENVRKVVASTDERL